MAQLIYITPTVTDTIRQGEILSSVEVYNLDIESLGADERLFIKVEHPFAIVVSQDCDLLWDFNAREKNAQPQKLIPTILFCEVTTAQQLKGNAVSTKHWERIVDNKDERYQFLESVEAVQDLLGLGLPELGIDFKRLFSIPTAEVYAQIARGVIWGTGGVFAAHGPLPLQEARAIRDNVEQPRLWDEDLGDELDFALDRGEIEIIDAAPH